MYTTTPSTPPKTPAVLSAQLWFLDDPDARHVVTVAHGFALLLRGGGTKQLFPLLSVCPGPSP